MKTFLQDMGKVGTSLTVRKLSRILDELKMQGHGNCQVVVVEDDEIIKTPEQVAVKITEANPYDGWYVYNSEDELIEAADIDDFDEDGSLETKAVVILV